MLLFWILAGALSVLAALLILARARRADRSAGEEDPTLPVYRRQLAEIDELAEQGLLAGTELKAARAEAARRLLRQSERAEGRTPLPSARARPWVLAGALIAPALALAAYLAVGSPGLPDQPFAARMKSWQAMVQRDPSSLRLDEAIALLRTAAAGRPKDPTPLVLIARLEQGGGDFDAAARDLEHAARLDPGRAEIWSQLGLTLTLKTGEVGPDARTAFQRALALDPNQAEPRYFLARARIAAGDREGGLADWRALLASLPPTDQRRADLQGEIDRISKGEALQSLAPSQATPQPAQGGADQAAFIQAMVDRLAARLKSQPDDPEGWARLIRAYSVLGQADKRTAAIERARQLFKDRPDALKTALSTAGG